MDILQSLSVVAELEIVKESRLKCTQNTDYVSLLIDILCNRIMIVFRR